jgi:hypothetical protein
MEIMMNEHFRQLAEDFKNRIRGTTITANTDVILIMKCVDRSGNPVPAVRNSIVPITRVRFPGREIDAIRFAASGHLDAILGNIDSLVASTPDEFVMIDGGPHVPVRIVDYELEIEEPGE